MKEARSLRQRSPGREDPLRIRQRRVRHLDHLTTRSFEPYPGSTGPVPLRPFVREDYGGVDGDGLASDDQVFDRTTSRLGPLGRLGFLRLYRHVARVQFRPELFKELSLARIVAIRVGFEVNRYGKVAHEVSKIIWPTSQSLVPVPPAFANHESYCVDGTGTKEELRRRVPLLPSRDCRERRTSRPTIRRSAAHGPAGGPAGGTTTGVPQAGSLAPSGGTCPERGVR